MTKPARLSAMGERFAPISFNKYIAITLVPPIRSKKMPMMVPKAITNPIPESVFPKPPEMLEVISCGESPNPNPPKMAAKTNEITGCILNLIVATIINTTNKRIIKKAIAK